MTDLYISRKDVQDKALLTLDIFDKIIKIEEIPAISEFVYDISVEGTENFVAGTGNIFAHNIINGAGKSAIRINAGNSGTTKNIFIYGNMFRDSQSACL